uniref:Uncharacterized protein n=1 Tax=Borrelia garinii subsp. bavariensis (strain ATCC BAA-2496 / DSM 23469 / PBi) TaxID=290434 RepID=A0A7M4BL01_BORGP|nr:hypothetical protein BGP309 [Borreliella bavariensis PBi]
MKIKGLILYEDIIGSEARDSIHNMLGQNIDDVDASNLF